jgi:hypothetical protein
MKRTFTGLALATTVALLGAAPVQAAAAPADPVKVLKGDLAAGKGVRFTERTSLDVGGGTKMVVLRRTGSFAFGRSGIVASDITGKLAIKASDLPEENRALLIPERTIRIGTTAYISGGLVGSLLPEGKTWFKAPGGPPGGSTGVFGGLINVAEPATLEALVGASKRTGSVYTGKITYSRLAKISPWFRAVGHYSRSAAKTVVSWKLTLDAQQHVKSLTTSHKTKALAALTIQTDYSGWGGRITIKTPPADQISTTLKSGEDELPEGPIDIGAK